MKVLHINTGQEGGAAWCVIRLAKALESLGVESRFLFGNGRQMPDGCEGDIAELDWMPALRNKNRLARLINNLLIWLEILNPIGLNYEKIARKIRLNNPDALYLHGPYSHYKSIAHHPLVEWADIIHLHWVADFVDYPSFFKDVKKPIVWTLHDKFPAVGLEHYCGINSSLPESLKDLDEKCVRIKRKGVLEAESVQVVAISEQMKDICLNSEVLKGFPCTLIHNGVNCGVFKPTENAEFATQLPRTAKVFLFSAFNIWDENKGLHRVIDALEKVECGDKLLIVIGDTLSRIPEASFPIICTGLVRNESDLAAYYSLSNYFILASYEETFAQTPLEAMACGTPVISTPCSGASDLIRPFNGVICDGYDADSLARGIEKALDTEYEPDIIRQHIIEEYDYSKIAGEYIELYKRIL